MSLFDSVVKIGSLVMIDGVGDLTGSDDAAAAAEKAARLSADATLKATEKNIDFQKWLWGEQTDLQQPYMDAGTEGLSDYQGMLDTGFNYDQYSDPSTQFRKNEGQKSIENSAAAKGMTLSGKNLKDMTRFGQDYASTEYGNAYNRWQKELANRYGLVRTGQAAASGTAQSGTSMGNQVSGSILDAGRANAGMYQDIGNIQGANAMSGWNTLMDVGGLAANFYKG
jgi:hypothetical protein